MTPANPDALADAPYVLLKRGLFERPGHHGYTGVLRHAGRFSHEEASAYAVHGGSVTMMLASEAPAYSPACWHETQVEDLLDLLRIEREAKAAAEARAAQLQAEVEAKDRAILLLLPFVDYAAGEGLMFVETEDGDHPEMDAADIMAATADALGLELGSDAYLSLLPDGYAAIRAARAATAREG
ncbi:hypothetical protein [Methylorubrum extorquens]|uniref:Uncharacterized protein n=1 Tax=Methylorubrum extorquens (strain ATCC 14718 / DSM 1338 / JCM 2805 / NCIMB 9133 / AM1) TaxID=272630 RepID=C5B0N7_METEA|nr:hypothetical protein [Methylorubrum extorquens]ACS41624.1 Hypothetical protein MexAM1_META1p3941 [Methylorubrum extorquens AM1]MCP1545364.1 hypothetical protein [Methylorubrum extorquens]MCP1587289.1 hypothetical protein [Methylorubrum extorquens]